MAKKKTDEAELAPEFEVLHKKKKLQVAFRLGDKVKMVKDGTKGNPYEVVDYKPGGLVSDLLYVVEAFADGSRKEVKRKALFAF